MSASVPIQQYHGLVLVTGGSNLTMSAIVEGTLPNIGGEATVSIKTLFTPIVFEQKIFALANNGGDCTSSSRER